MVNIGPFASGLELSAKHIYSNKGTYTIKAKAVDEHNALSDESTFKVIITKSKAINKTLILQDFLQGFPFMVKILKLIL